jgi:hypothetical protein
MIPHFLRSQRRHIGRSMLEKSWTRTPLASNFRLVDDSPGTIAKTLRRYTRLVWRPARRNFCVVTMRMERTRFNSFVRSRLLPSAMQ